jgi:hypothetical protein
MVTARMPQDRKTKAGGDGRFTFTHKGKSYTFPNPVSAVTSPGFLRANRRRDELDLSFTIIEILADNDPDILAAIDSMPLAEFNRLSRRLSKTISEGMEAAPEMGESEAS